MTFTFSVATAAVLLIAFGFLLIIHRLAHSKPDAVPDLDWCRNFSVAKYRPMERLFLEDDYEFLAAQPGSNRRILRNLRAERRRIFLRYLRALGRDFDRLHSAAKILVVHSPEDMADLAKVLMRQKLMFEYLLAMMQCRLALQSFGIGTVDARPLVGVLDSLRLQFRSLPQAQTSAA